MWMQILIAAGFPAIGEAFPRRWQEYLMEANPSGFFESTFRQGIYYRTNPHPASGHFLFPSQVKHHVVKVFIPGLVRSDLAYIHRVIATIRPWREYVTSLRRLYALEAAKMHQEHPERPQPVRMPPALEWWSENFTLMCDIATRRYPVHVQSYDGLLRDVDGVIGRVLKWLGQGDVGAAVAAVKPEHRTQKAPQIDVEDCLDEHVAQLCDELYTRIDEGRGLEPNFIAELNRINESLRPQIRNHLQAIRDDADRRKVKRQTNYNHAFDFDLLEGLEQN